MRCEVIAVGTELLLGQIVDTNSSWIGEQLALAGINAHYQTKVGDNLERIVDALRIALERSDAVITCGGLGPTQDDITRNAIAKIMGVPLIRDQHIVERIRERFHSRGREMPDNNLLQADVPQGASVIPQMPGTAPGLICPVGDKVIYAVPGVPWELKQMVNGTIVPDLRRRSGETAVIRSRILRTWGQSESGLAEMLAGRIEELDRIGNPTLAFLASGIEGLKVRITAKAADEAEAEHLIASEETRLRELMGHLVFGVDDQTMESVVVDLLRQQSLTLAVAESLTGGLLSFRFSAISGVEQVFRGAVVCAPGPLQSQLGIPQGPIPSPQAAEAMAEGVREMLGADIGLATTEVAGSDAPQGVPEWAVFLGLAGAEGTASRLVQLPGKRSQIRQFAVIGVLNWLRLRLLAG